MIIHGRGASVHGFYEPGALRLMVEVIIIIIQEPPASSPAALFFYSAATAAFLAFRAAHARRIASLRRSLNAGSAMRARMASFCPG
jgi:hypothetical protein